MNTSLAGKSWQFVRTHRHQIANVLKYVLAGGLLTWVVWSNWAPASGHGLKEVWDDKISHGKIQYHYFALALLFCAASVSVTFVRWFFLVRAQKLPFTMPNAFRLGSVAFFFNTFLPGSVGGDIIKAAFIAREQQSRRTTAVATVIMDRAIALWGLVCFVALLGSGFWLAGWLTNEASRQIVVIAQVVVVGSLFGWFLLFFLPDHRAERFAGRLGRLPKVGHAAAEFWRAAWMYHKRKPTLGLAVALSWIGFVGFVLSFYFSVLTLWDGSDPALQMPTLVEHFLIVPIGLVIQAIPLFPGGAGIGELGYGALYSWFGCAAASGVLGSLVYRVINWILGGVGYVVYLRMKPSLPVAESNDLNDESPAPDSHALSANANPLSRHAPTAAT